MKTVLAPPRFVFPSRSTVWLLALFTLLVSGRQGAQAANLFESAANGPWNLASTWNVSADGGVTWTAATTIPDPTVSAIFLTNDFTVTVTNFQTATNLMVDTGSTLVLAGTGILSSTNTSATTNTFAYPILLNGGFNDANPSAGGTTSEHLNGIISGTGGVTNSGVGILTLAGANTFTGGLYAYNGTVAGTLVNNCFGAGPITLGSASGGSVTLSTGKSPTNPITLGTGAIGTLIITNIGGATAAVYSGAINLNGDNLTIGAGGVSTTIKGGITGTGNLLLNNASTNSAGNGLILSTVAINNAGSITLQGAGTGATAISAVIGANVTAVTNNSASSQLVLSGTNTYAGPTAVKAGKLVEVAGGSAANSALIIVSATAITSVSVTNNTLAWTWSSLATPAAGNLDFNFGSILPSTTMAPLQINGLANFSSLPTVSVEMPLTVTVGTYPLMTWGSTAGTAPSNVILPPGISGNLSVSGNTLNLVITHVGNLLLWTGSANNQWDTSSFDWVDLGNGNNPTNYQQAGGVGDVVTFDDTALNATVNVGTTITPSLMTFNNLNANYVFSGPGSISGAGSLIKAGAGALTLGMVNTFTGGSVVTNGTVFIGADSALGTGSIKLGTNGVISPAGGSFTLSNAFASVTAGTVNFGVTNGSLTLQGNLVLNGGALYVTGGSNLVIHAIVQSLATGSGLDIFNGSRVILDGAHATNASDGIRFHSSGGFGVTELDLTNNAVYVVGTTAGAANIRMGQDAGVFGTNILQISSGLLLMTNTAASIYVGDKANTTGLMYQEGGVVRFQTANPTNSGIHFGLSILAYGEYHLDGGSLSTPVVITPDGSTGNLYLNGGILVASANAFASDFLNGTTVYVQAGGANINDGGFAININEALLDGTGGGGLTKTGSGMLLLNGLNTYTGTTLVNTGILGGNGTISGPVSVAAGATLAAGTNTVVGTLTINNNLTLAADSQVFMRVNKDSMTSDLVTGLANVAYTGSTLVITNIGVTALAAGDTFQLFNASGTTTGNFSSVVVHDTTGVLGGTFNPATGVLTIGSTIPTTPTNLTFSVASGNMTISWPGNYLGWSLQVQTNSLSQGLGTNWVTVPGSSGVTVTNFPVGPANGAVFYRLYYQP